MISRRNFAFILALTMAPLPALADGNSAEKPGIIL